MGVMHRAFAISSTVATAAAAALPGSVVNDLRNGEGEKVMIGHPSGILPATAVVVQKEGAWVAENVGVHRTARHILQGSVFV